MSEIKSLPGFENILKSIMATESIKVEIRRVRRKIVIAFWYHAEREERSQGRNEERRYLIYGIHDQNRLFHINYIFNIPCLNNLTSFQIKM